MPDTTTIRCLCELKVGDLAIRNNEVFELVESENQTYKIKNLETDEELTLNEEEAGEYESVDDSMPKQDEQLTRFIRMCQKCQVAMKPKTEKEKVVVKAAEEEPKTEEIKSADEDKVGNDMSMILEALKSIGDKLTGLESAKMTSVKAAEEEPKEPETKKDEELETEKDKEASKSIKSFKPAIISTNSIFSLKLQKENTQATNSIFNLKL